MVVKLSKFAKLNDIGYRAAWNRYKDGKIPNAYEDINGRIFVNISDENKTKNDFNVIYARVSTYDQKLDLDRQVDRLLKFSNARGLTIHKVIKEIASGLNDDRPKLNSLLSDHNITNIIIEYKYRLTRFGFNHIKNLLKHINCNIILMNEIDGDREDLIRDFISMNKTLIKKFNKDEIKEIINNLNLDSYVK